MKSGVRSADECVLCKEDITTAEEWVQISPHRVLLEAVAYTKQLWDWKDDGIYYMVENVK